MNILQTTPNLNYRKNLGFTLMEVLIAMAIGVVVLVGALSYFGTGVRSMQTADAYARMHENASRAASIIGRDVQLAGFYGFGGSARAQNIMSEDGNLFSSGGSFIPPYSETVHYADATASVCGARYLLPLQNDNRALPIEYYEDSTEFQAALTAALPSNASPVDVANCVPNIINNSPILVVRGALEGVMINDSINILGTELPTVGLLSNRRLYITAIPTANIDARNVFFFFGRGSAETAVANFETFTWPRAWSDGLIQQKASGDYFPVFQYQFRVYYLRNFFDTPGDNIPTLVRRQLIDGNAEFTVRTVVERMVSGVEAMNFLWGIDDRGSFRVNSDVAIGDGITDWWSEALPANQFGNVNALRMQVLMRSPTADGSYNDRNITYNFDGVIGSRGQFNCADIEADFPPSCRHRRLLYETSTSARNCTLRRRAGLLNTGGC